MKFLYAAALCTASTTPALAQSVQDMADTMGFCTSVVASRNFDVAPVPDNGVELFVSPTDEGWTCEMVAGDEQQMIVAAQALLSQFPDAVVEGIADPNGATDFLTAGFCIGDVRVTLLVNGPSATLFEAGYAVVGSRTEDSILCQ